MQKEIILVEKNTTTDVRTVTFSSIVQRFVNCVHVFLFFKLLSIIHF